MSSSFSTSCSTCFFWHCYFLAWSFPEGIYRSICHSDFLNTANYSLLHLQHFSALCCCFRLRLHKFNSSWLLIAVCKFFRRFVLFWFKASLMSLFPACLLYFGFVLFLGFFSIVFRFGLVFFPSAWFIFFLQLFRFWPVVLIIRFVWSLIAPILSSFHPLFCNEMCIIFYPNICLHLFSWWEGIFNLFYLLYHTWYLFLNRCFLYSPQEKLICVFPVVLEKFHTQIILKARRFLNKC